jgi:superfamily II DNA or RNA helicase
MDSYLGQKGYTISKACLTVEEQKKIRNDLIIKPFTLNSPGNGETFPVYRESNNKMYIPHYYGIENFGMPKNVKLHEGLNINLNFQGKLRESQIQVVDKYVNYVLNELPYGVGGGLIELPCGQGKTVIALNIISRLNKKTLVIVNKEDLMRQWIERINQFLPNVRVGKIQGQIIDIDNKDIVIGMLQSLSMKEYPTSVFESFGLTIIDEVHHISSQTFSNALFKIITKYMLGLSATMNRKDGTTFVFKMFLGDIVYKGVREEKYNVTVRAIEYYIEDEEFNEIKTDWRGKVMYSSMISKLCEYNRRSEFILRVIKDMIGENEKQQIMVLAHNKNLLKYLYDAIKHRNIGTVGYYIGGMKESDLKVSEGKQIIIATYSMASEGLDIKTLSTLIMATPRTDIEQSVGRILREKHNDPIIVDIIDSHEPFKNQWRKRKTFYKKENYKIIHTLSDNYTPNIQSWHSLYNPCTNEKTVKKVVTIKSHSFKSNSSNDKSITNSDNESDGSEYLDTKKKDKLFCGKCLLTL